MDEVVCNPEIPLIIDEEYELGSGGSAVVLRGKMVWCVYVWMVRSGYMCMCIQAKKFWQIWEIEPQHRPGIILWRISANNKMLL